MSAPVVKATMALVAKHMLVVDKAVVEAWVQVPPQCVGVTTTIPKKRSCGSITINTETDNLNKK